MQPLLALSPLIIVCVALGFKRSAITAALLGITAILILGSLFFPFSVEATQSTIETLGLPIVEIALIIFGGILLAELMERVGAQNYITEKLVAATGTPERATLLMVVGLAPFLESSIGYGLGIIITVPLLRKMGNNATKSVALSLFGLTLTPWGSLGPGLIVTSELGEITLNSLGQNLAWLSIVPLIVLNTALTLIAVPRRSRAKYLIEVYFVSVVMWGAVLVTNYFISVPLGGIFGALVGILAFLLIAQFRGISLKSLADRKLLISATPYLVIIIGVIIASVIAPFFEMPLLTRIATSPATWLIISGPLSSAIMGVNASSVRDLFITSGKRWLKPGTVVVLYMLFGGLLNASGMSTALAEGAAQFGLWNLLLVPGVNIIAGYITASISATGAMFSLSVAETATQLGMQKSSLLALQTMASAKACIISPSRFALAAASLTEVKSSPSSTSTNHSEGAIEGGADTARVAGSAKSQTQVDDKDNTVQVGKIVFAGFGMIGIMMPFLIGITWILGF